MNTTMASTVPLSSNPDGAITTPDAYDDEEGVDATVPLTTISSRVDAETLVESNRISPLEICSAMAMTIGIIALLLWPWVMIGILAVKGDIAIPDRHAEFLARYPFVKTVAANIIIVVNPAFINFFFRRAMVWYGRVFVARRNPERRITVFNVSVLLACKFGNSVWEILQIDDWGRETKRLLVVISFFVLKAAFTSAPGATAGLIYPRTFKKTESLRGEELDVTGELRGCGTWLESVRLEEESSCRWKTARNLQNSTCRSKSQISEILNSRRRNLLDLNSNTTLRSFPKSFGVDEGVTFLGSPRGILPLGLNGSPASGALSTPNNPFPDPMMQKGIRLYNYTLYQQGLECEVDCKYDTTSPVVMGPMSGEPMFLEYSGVCDPTAGLEAVLNGVQSYRAINTNTTLGFWACKRPASTFYPDVTYFLYLRGRLPDVDSIANVTCALSSLRPAIFPVTYSSVTGHFVVGNKTNQEDMTHDESLSTGFVEEALAGLGIFMQEEQSRLSSPFVELMASLEARPDTPPGRQVNSYLRFSEEMILKTLEYEAMYMRLIYSAVENRPAVCTRNVTGNATFLAMGWSDEDIYSTAGALLPMSVASLTSLSVVLVTLYMRLTQKYSRTMDFPVLIRSVLWASVVSGDGGTRSKKIDWGDKVVYTKSDRS